jgi:hypothetical protein
MGKRGKGEGARAGGQVHKVSRTEGEGWHGRRSTATRLGSAHHIAPARVRLGTVTSTGRLPLRWSRQRALPATSTYQHAGEGVGRCVEAQL